MKKKIPLEVLELIEKYVNLKGEEFEVINPGEFLLKIIDRDKNSDFYFNIEQYKKDKGIQFLINYKPRDKQSLDNHKIWTSSKGVDDFLSVWISLLEGYSNVNSFFDDPILNSYANDYYTEFKIIEENADIEPFKPAQILMLDQFLENIENNIENYQTIENKEGIQEIKRDIVDLRESLTSNTKSFIIKKLSNIFAKITKQSSKMFKEFLSEVKKESIKQIVKGGINLLIESMNK